MSNTDIVQFGFAVDTAPLNAADAALAQLEKRAASVEATLTRMSNNVAAAMARVPAGMVGMAGPSAAGGSTAVAGGAWDANAVGIAAVTRALDGYSGASAKAASATAATTSALHGATAAHGAHGAAAYANRLQMMELMHVGRALFDEMAVGGNIFRALAMEGGRLQIALSSGEGGLTGLLGRIGTGFSAIANPAVIAAAAIGTVTAASVAAAVSYENSQARLQRAVEGTGRASGLTANQLRAIADTGAANANMGLGEARGVASGFAQAGLPAGMTASLLGATPRFARFTDQDNASAGAALAGDFRDPVAGVKKLDDSLGFLNARLLQTIEDMKASGDMEGARRVELEAFNAALKQTTDSTWALGEAYREAKRWGGSVIDAVGHGINHVLGGDQSPEDQLAGYKRMLPNTFDSPLAIGNLSRSYVQAQIDRLQHEIDTKIDPEAAARGARANELSLQATPLIKSLLPEMMKAQSVADNLTLLRTVLSDPATLSVLPMARSSVVQAYGRESVMAANADPDRRAQQDYQLRLADADAFSIGEKAVVDARRAELQVLRETGDVARAAAAAQMSMNEAIAKGNSDAQDRLDAINEKAGLIGLSGLARTLAEIDLKYEGTGGILGKDEVTNSRVLNDPDIKGDLEGASKKVAAALDDLPSRIQSGGEKIAAAMDSAATRIASGGTPAGASASPFGTLKPFDYAHGSAAATAPELDMMRQMVARGINPASAAGFVAGTTMESSPSLDPLASNGTHNGMAQWDAGRWARIQQAYGPSAMTRAGQMQGVFLELGTNEAGAGRMLAGSNSVLGGIAASDAYERPGDAEAARRRPVALARADSILAAYQGTPGAPAGLPADRTTLSVPSAAQTVAPIAPIATATDLKGQASERSQAISAANIGLLQSGGNQIVDLAAQLKGQADAFSQTSDKIAAMTFEQKLLTQAQHEMITLSPSLRSAIHEEATTVGDLTKKIDDQREMQQQVMAVADAARGGLSSAVSSGFVGLAQGHGFGKSFKSGLSSLGDRLIGLGTNDIFGGLLGQQGKGLSTGLLGNLFHFAGGTSDAPGGPTVVGESGPELIDMPKHAQVMNASQTSGLMAARGAPTVNVGGHSIVVQGNADAKTLDAMDAKIAAANQQQYERIVRDLPQLQSDSAQYS